MARGAYPYVAMRPPGPILQESARRITGAPAQAEVRVPLPIDSPTLMTRRRYDLRGSLQGFLRTGTLAAGPTGAIAPHPWPGNGKITPQWPHLTGSDVGTFEGSITGLEKMPDRLKMPIGLGLNLLSAIAHRSTHPAPAPALNAGLWLSDRSMKARPRRYALPFQIPSPQSYQSWPTSSQWLASMMPGMGG